MIQYSIKSIVVILSFAFFIRSEEINLKVDSLLSHKLDSLQKKNLLIQPGIPYKRIIPYNAVISKNRVLFRTADSNVTNILLNHKKKIDSTMYYHIDFIQTINIREYDRYIRRFQNKNYYYNLKIKIFNLNCNPVFYEIALLNSRGIENTYSRGQNFNYHENAYEIERENGVEHTIYSEYLKSKGIKHLIIKYYKKNGGKNAENLIPISKPLKIQTEYTLQLTDNSKIIPPIIKNLPGIKKKICSD